MRTIRRRWCSNGVCGAIPAILLVLSGTARAQSGSPPVAAAATRFDKGTVEAGAIGGVALPVSWLRAHGDRHLTMASLQVGRVMTSQIGHGPLAGHFEFLLEVSPFLIVQQPSSVFGFTASPLHMRWNFASLSARRIRPFAEASGGIVYTSSPVPVRATTSFNFIDQAGFGLRFETRAKRAWLAGYRFQHISNAGRAKPNPGANFNFAYVGVSFLR